MGIGLGIFLIVLGAILTFALNMSVSGIDLHMVGIICMIAGVLSLIIGLVMNQQRSHVRTDAVVEHRETGLPRDARDPRY